jgi:hypothetical protein
MIGMRLNQIIHRVALPILITWCIYIFEMGQTAKLSGAEKRLGDQIGRVNI